MKLKVGIIFGGSSREREISFAGGRTVYDNLNKSLFEPLPLFVDSFGNFVLLNWEYIYKGSIRDFYPPIQYVPASKNDFQVYAESLGDLEKKEQFKMIFDLGTRIEPSGLPELIDFAFLCLHGSDGEDGRMQGLLEYLRIPYSGSGILSSAIGMNKVVQKKLMQNAGFNVPRYFTISRNEWLDSKNKTDFFGRIKQEVGLPCVVKSANQGSSIGVSVVSTEDENVFKEALNKSFFIKELYKQHWEKLSFEEKTDEVRTLCDIREGIGLPLKIENKVIYHPEEVLSIIIQLIADGEQQILMSALDGDSEVIIEEFIEGKEFSCIVIENANGLPVALPPTEIRKGKEVFDYRSKYLPGLSRKITPIDLPEKQLKNITVECERLFSALQFNVYARIDGFLSKDGRIILNDPNTTSGMMPSSFFFHQAAEIGLNPSQFVTYIIRTSLAARISDFKSYAELPGILQQLDIEISNQHKKESFKTKIAVLLGGFSTERHISVESGRNIYEKLSSSEKYEPLPVFVTGSENNGHKLHIIPVNILLKDNADDIKEKIEHSKVHPFIKEIVSRCEDITAKYATTSVLQEPRLITYEELAKIADGVFIALHGRPGEDGEVQANLDRVNLPYNGSTSKVSQVTIDKFRTNEVLMDKGLLAPSHLLVHKEDWKKQEEKFYEYILSHFKFPFIAKPFDDGCSSAVKKIHNTDELKAFCKLIFREEDALDQDASAVLDLKPKEEFPKKKGFLIEELISSGQASRFMEITGGLLTHYNAKGEIEYEVFDASEALTEGDVLSLEEKFLAGQGQNITPARYSPDLSEAKVISEVVKRELEKAARILNIQGYARIDAFVRIYGKEKVEVIFIEVNSLPGMTPATCIFHQAALNHYKPFDFIDSILDFGFRRKNNTFENTKQ